jgi:hypothetical protein
MFFGPNTATGHTSVILAIENTLNYALKLIKPVLQGEVSEFEVKEEADSTYRGNVQAASKKTVFLTCKSVCVSGFRHVSFQPII